MKKTAVVIFLFLYLFCFVNTHKVFAQTEVKKPIALSCALSESIRSYGQRNALEWTLNLTINNVTGSLVEFGDDIIIMEGTGADLFDGSYVVYHKEIPSVSSSNSDFFNRSQAYAIANFERRWPNGAMQGYCNGGTYRVADPPEYKPERTICNTKLSAGSSVTVEKFFYQGSYIKDHTRVFLVLPTIKTGNSKYRLMVTFIPLEQGSGKWKTETKEIIYLKKQDLLKLIEVSKTDAVKTVLALNWLAEIDGASALPILSSSIRSRDTGLPTVASIQLLSNLGAEPDAKTLETVKNIASNTGSGWPSLVAKRYLKNKDLADIERYQKALKLKPNVSELHNKLGRSFVNIKRYQEAVDSYKQAITLRPNYAEAYFSLGMAYEKLSRFQEAFENYKLALSIKPDFSEVYGNLGHVYAKLDQYQEGLDALQQAIKIYPNNAEAYDNLGYIYAKTGQDQEAITALKQAITLGSNNAETYNNLGYFYSKHGQYKESYELLKQSIILNPDNVEAQYNLGIVCENLDLYPEAAEAYENTTKLNLKHIEGYYHLGVICEKLGRHLDAANAFTKAASLKPDYADAYYNLGISSEKLGKKREAIEAYTQTVKIQPNNIDAYKRLGYLHSSALNHQLAIEAYKMVVQLEPEDAESHYKLGQLYYRFSRWRMSGARNKTSTQGKLVYFPEAIAALKQAIKLKPEYDDAHIELWRVYTVMEDKANAAEEYKILKKLSPRKAERLFP